MKNINQPGFVFGETLSISTLGPSSRLPEKVKCKCDEPHKWCICLYFCSLSLCYIVQEKHWIPLLSSSFFAVKGFSDVEELRHILGVFTVSGTAWVLKQTHVVKSIILLHCAGVQRADMWIKSHHTPVPVNADWRNPPACRLVMLGTEEPDCQATTGEEEQ